MNRQSEAEKTAKNRAKRLKKQAITRGKLPFSDSAKREGEQIGNSFNFAEEGGKKRKLVGGSGIVFKRAQEREGSEEMIKETEHNLGGKVFVTAGATSESEIKVDLPPKGEEKLLLPVREVKAASLPGIIIRDQD